MGNRHNKDASKPKEVKKNEKNVQKGRKKEKGEKRKKQPGQSVLDHDIDFDESSHVTGGDSESCVFHSAENISFSPYLDSSTRSEHEQGAAWSAVLEQASLGAQHPYVLSSKDFQDGFSLEACIPSEIARLGDYNDVSSTTNSRHRQRNASLNSSTTSKLPGDLTASFTGSHSSASGENSSNFPTTASPSVGTTDRGKVPLSPTSTPVEKCFRSGSQEKQPLSPTSGYHHPHFYNHNRTYQPSSPLRVTEPKSPQPQRRTLSPKISSHFKTATSESSSPPPSTPGPQRRAANFLALFRSSSKRGKGAANNDEDSKTDSTSDETRGRSYSTSNDSDRKVKSKPAWTTWERPRSKKSKKPVKDSIFGTSRKSDKQTDKICNAGAADKEVIGAFTAPTGNLLPMVTYTRVHEKETQNKSSSAVLASLKHSQVTLTPGSSKSEAKEKVSCTESGPPIRERSPPLSSTAAVCIMKLEELERSIEKTIREKFPDAEPFLIKERSKEELHGSRSLPATPSNKKKLHLARDEGTQFANTKLHNKVVTRYYNETYESPPSPSTSPIVLRRFGARTRHASISPKMQRAKTAALFNSPSEMSSFGASRVIQSTTQVPVCHRLSSHQAEHPEIPRMFSAAQKSESKYDNVMADEDTSAPIINLDNCSPHRHEQFKDTNGDQVSERSVDHSQKNRREQPEVIIPTSSAVFGSVSPKLRRHLQVQFDEIKDNTNKDKTGTDKDIHLPNYGNKNETNHKVLQGRQEMERKDAKTGLSSPACLDSPDIAPSLITSNEKLLQERSLQFTDKYEERANEEQKTTQSHKARYKASEFIGTASLPADRTEGINYPLSETKATRKKDAEEKGNDNTKSGLSSSPQGAGKPSNEEGQEENISFEQRKTLACAVSSPATQSEEIGGTKIPVKSGQLSSSATKRTHSTDRVLLFDSAVSSPDRSIPTSLPFSATPGHESTSSEKNSAIAQAQNAPLNQRHGCRLASTRNIVDNRQPETELSQPSSYFLLSSAVDKNLSAKVTFSGDIPAVLSSAVDENLSAKVIFSGDIPAVLSKEEVTSQISLPQGDFISESRTQDAKVSVIQDSEPGRVISDKGDEPSCSVSSSLVSQTPTDVFCGPGINDNSVNAVRLHQGRERANVYTFTQEEERVSVFKQPVSEVISQMIIRSKLKPQNERRIQQQQLQPQQHQHQQQQQRLNNTSPNQAVVQTQLVTIRKYEQLSEVLERKCVQGPASPIAVSINEDLCQSRCQEIQTDLYTTADKSVDSRGLIDTKENFELSKSLQTHNLFVPSEKSVSETTEDKQTTSGTESEVGKMASGGSETSERELVEKSCTSEHVPPPSPTALQQLIEEFEGEDEDVEEGEDVQAIITMNREQMEIKEFSDTVYKRLSELLDSNKKEDDDDKEDNNQSDNDEPQDSASEKEDFPLRGTQSEDIASSNKEVTTRTETCASIQTGFPVSPLVKILTVDTSSSLSTTTSSESDLDDAPLMFHSFQNDENNDECVFKNTDDYANSKGEEMDLAFREFDEPQLQNPHEPDHKPNSREYHSDDDVAKGRGIPDYYDDKPLWSRRQKPPGQLSAAMMAIRWRERRERWLKKRRRNRTDLMSTGSSDTGSEYSLNRYAEPPDDNYFDNDNNEDNITKRTNDMGSGILTSPKYSKPILPFFGSQTGSAEPEISGHVHSMVHRRKRHDSRSNRSASSIRHGSNSAHNDDRDKKCPETSAENKDRENGNETSAHSSSGVKSATEVPTIEDTFQELMSVQTILKEMQECKGSASDNTEKPHLLPLTTENVRSIREYYKDFYSSGNGRRSRMSATDRTESDLDLYSEMQDDASSESELYADDEGDDDGQEPYATAEDDPGATGRGNSAGGRPNKRDEARLGKDEEDESDTSLVLSCTFYNSKTHQQQIDATEPGPTTIYPLEIKSTHRPTPTPQPPTTYTSLNSDDEFWSGSALIDESYRQLETAADGVSSTFQNAREQMHDIQYHLQALRRQMEDMHSDLTNVSLSLSQSTSTEYFKK